jgi:hypothetical protein
MGAYHNSSGEYMRCAYTTLVLSLTVIEVLAVLCVFTQPAYAYIDPGSGLFALQTISTTILGIVFLIRRKVRRLIGARDFASKSEKVTKQ